MISKSDWDQVVLDHLELCPGVRLPEIATPEGIRYWEEWRRRFEGLQIPVRVIRKAFEQVRTNPPRDVGRHMPAVFDVAVALRTRVETVRTLNEYRRAPVEPAFDPDVQRGWEALGAIERECWFDKAQQRHPGLAAFPALLEPIARAMWHEAMQHFSGAEIQVRKDDPASGSFVDVDF